MKKNYLSPKEIETIDINKPLSQKRAKELHQKLTTGVLKYKEKLQLVEDIPVCATIAFTFLGFSNTIIGAIKHFTDATSTAPNEAFAASTFAAGAVCLAMTAVTTKQCNKKIDNLLKIATPKAKKLEQMMQVSEEVEDEIM